MLHITNVTCLHLLVKNILNCIIYVVISYLYYDHFYFLLTNLNVVYCAFNLYFILKKYNCVSHLRVLIKYIKVLFNVQLIIDIIL